MKAREIKALHEAMYSQYRLLLQYSARILDDMPEGAALNQFKENKMYSKAEQVAQACDAAYRDNLYCRDCYRAAIDAAVTLGGIIIENSPMTETSASRVTFEFDDLSRAQIKYGSVFVIC